MSDPAAQRSVIGCVIPAYNEEESIARVLESLLSQTRVPDVIHVVVNNTSDETVRVASRYAGPHEVVTELGEQFTEVFVHDIGRNRDEKVGALNYGYALVEGSDYLLGVDGDTVAESDVVAHLEAEAVSDARIGGITTVSPFVDPPLRDGAPSTPSQLSIFSMQALRDVLVQNHRAAPWVRGAEGGDPLLAVQIKRAGYVTRVDRFARADGKGTPRRRDGASAARQGVQATSDVRR